ncbi:MAG: glycosyltransferase family 2 protein [Alistipes sp.]|nr:glycosyltransferase family 2 protein [Alistipes sp.]MBR3775520.1 glycosyltransferase family 2 protein [Alistipes sp.]
MVRISLVIATYNRAEQLMTTLVSVAAQSLAPEAWECVVVDNNSTDATRERVAAFGACHPELHIRYIFEREQGLSAARNAGIAASQGDIIAFVDDDERIIPDFLGAYVDLFDSHPEAMAAGGCIIAEYPTGRPRWMSRFTEQPIANPMNYGATVRVFPKGKIPGGGNMAFRREALVRVGIFDTSLGRTGKSLIGGEESDLFERMAAVGIRPYYVPRAVMYHIIPAEKLTREYFLRLCYNTGVSQRRRAELHDRVWRLYVGEVAKWCATLALCLVHRPCQSRALIAMRREISRGIWRRS